MLEGKQVLLHRHLMKAAEGQTVDHKNLDKGDCRKDNLRLASYSQNNVNKVKTSKETTSKYKGVYKYVGRPAPWWAHIKFNNKRKSLGYFRTELEAAKAYNKAAKELHGEFASLNDIP